MEELAAAAVRRQFDLAAGGEQAGRGGANERAMLPMLPEVARQLGQLHQPRCSVGDQRR